MIKLEQIKEALGHAFKITDGQEDMTKEDFDLLFKLSGFVVKRKLSVPAVMFLETLRPLNVVGSSMMSFFKPMLGHFFNNAEYTRLERILERRCSVGCLIDAIEKCERQFFDDKLKPNNDSK
ncbi:MAG: hypothetical protein A2381_16970 [Bdellovibrionales bacterium RIFOXYB1_FULL_37_110]|nr:MAG: hypothetical protein A2181_07975 [Bdellovibrionales bacterium RIFOXYA1_FULL_38_20]OFZ50089.1 MAG: hypothetical protein A2417_18805 [Bdellovibrionales bacterium RIFOXYC1_FULL_37_79]OFZ59995.1 MAG: hypothetical protein A2381_16970 [Bdellovibrionales bacterium RIFOXYB1_FULL_37_110]OFZ64282.1 MAG: hypothetical protein A2577_12685 [Bdellovibrionales bacterium RIFOXYD1_FULL_36_51]